MDVELKNLLKQTVTIAPYSSRNADNEFTYGAGVSVACRIQQRNTVIQDSKGRQVVSSTQIYVDGTITVTQNDKVTLPDGTHPSILNVYNTPDELGNSYYKCIFT